SPFARLGASSVSTAAAQLGCSGRASPARCAHASLVAVIAQQWFFGERSGGRQSVLGAARRRWPRQFASSERKRATERTCTSSSSARVFAIASARSAEFGAT